MTDITSNLLNDSTKALISYKIKTSPRTLIVNEFLLLPVISSE